MSHHEYKTDKGTVSIFDDTDSQGYEDTHFCVQVILPGPHPAVDFGACSVEHAKRLLDLLGYQELPSPKWVQAYELWEQAGSLSSSVIRDRVTGERLALYVEGDWHAPETWIEVPA